MTWIPYGPNAALLRFADEVGDAAFARCRRIVAALERHPPSKLVDFVPAFTTILLEFDPQQNAELSVIMPEVIQQLEQAADIQLHESDIKDLPVIYDGPDLNRVAELNGLTVDQVKELHAAPIYKVYMLGFAPGFPYLGDLDRRLHTPRLAVPRPAVPAGSVGIGGEHTGIYSVANPGGWNIIGHTPVAIFDIGRGRTASSDEAMFLLRSGDRLRFVPA